MDLSRVDRVLHTIDPAKLAATGLTITGVTVALLPIRSAPNAATVWTALTSYTAPTTAKMRLSGPDADSTGALAVPADCDLWVLVTDGTQTEAVKIERINVEGSGGSIPPLPSTYITSWNGKSGVVTATFSDVGADAAGAATTAQAAAIAAAATDATTKANAAQAAAVAAIPSMSTIAADPALRATFVLPASGSFTYNSDGTVASESNGKTYTYNADGTVHTETLSGVTRTYSYNADGTLASVA